MDTFMIFTIEGIATDEISYVPALNSELFKDLHGLFDSMRTGEGWLRDLVFGWMLSRVRKFRFDIDR
jgi:hypothetical protein